MPILQDHTTPDANPAADQRPRFGIGHISMSATDVDTMTDFYTAIGMRLVVNLGRASILELRGGTHLIIQEGAAGETSLDLIVDDVDETRALLDAHGASTTEITRGNPHDRFRAIDPEGNTLIVNSDHSMGVV